MELFIRSGRRYSPATPEQVLEAVAQYHLDQFPQGSPIRSPLDAKALVAAQLRGLESEHFGALWLNARHKVISWEILFAGTIDGATVHARTVVQSALKRNSAAVIFAHNHPSGDGGPSEADRVITSTLHRALELVDVRLLDHLVVGGSETISMAEHGGW